MSNPHIGSSLDDFLREEGILEEVNEAAARKVIAWQVKAELARRMETSRSQVDRILAGNDPGIRLDTLERAANAVGCTLHIELTHQ